MGWAQGGAVDQDRCSVAGGRVWQLTARARADRARAAGSRADLATRAPAARSTTHRRRLPPCSSLISSNGGQNGGQAGGDARSGLPPPAGCEAARNMPFQRGALRHTLSPPCSPCDDWRAPMLVYTAHAIPRFT